MIWYHFFTITFQHRPWSRIRIRQVNYFWISKTYVGRTQKKFQQINFFVPDLEPKTLKKSEFDPKIFVFCTGNSRIGFSSTQVTYLSFFTESELQNDHWPDKTQSNRPLKSIKFNTLHYLRSALLYISDMPQNVRSKWCSIWDLNKRFVQKLFWMYKMRLIWRKEVLEIKQN